MRRLLCHEREKVISYGRMHTATNSSGVVQTNISLLNASMHAMADC